MKKSDTKVDEDVRALIAESREIIEEVVPHIIRLGERLDDNQPADSDTVNHIFRAFHTIKGTSAFYQLNNVVAVTHKAETLLEFFRRGIAEINASCTDLLCQTCDVTEDLFELIETTGKDEGNEEAVRSIIYRLNGRINIFRDRLKDSGQSDITDLDSGGYSTKKSSDIAKKKVGENTRIFVSAGREVLDRLEQVANQLSRPERSDVTFSGELVEGLIESITLVLETAGFLQFYSIMELLQTSIDFLSSVRNSDYNVSPDYGQALKDICSIMNTVLSRIESKGTDDGLEQQIESAVGTLVQALPDGAANVIESVDYPDAPEESDSDILSDPDGYAVSGRITRLFLDESLDQLDVITNILMELRKDSQNNGLLQDAYSIFHSFTGSCGIMNFSDLEQLSKKIQDLFDAALVNGLEFDNWDFKAIWTVTCTIQTIIKEISDGNDGTIHNLDDLIKMLDSVYGNLSEEEKDSEIQLPEIDHVRKTDVLKLQDNAVSGIKTEAEAKSELSEEKASELKGPMIDTVTESGHDKEIAGYDPFFDTGFHRRIEERRDIRVNLDKLDELINLIGELVIAENMVVKNPDIESLELENFDRASLHLNKIVRDLQDVALSVRMIPIAGVFRKMIRLVHDLSAKSGKKVGLKLIGEDTEIDKTVAELIADPLVHLVRNAIDHGIKKNKNQFSGGEDGQIVLEARHEGGEVWVIVRDNGDGLDRKKILNRGIEVGVIEGDGSTLSDQEIDDLIFEPGFSTSDIVTDISGRGVGMDVVKKNVEKIKGHINVYSKPGSGTTFILRIPLTLAIIDGMLVKVGETSYTIPLLSIRESIQVAQENVTVTMDGQEMVRVRDELIPVIRLHELYQIETPYDKLDQGLLIVVEHQRETAGLFIDEIVGEQQTVIKGLSGYMENIRGISGCTILGDGEVSLIIDVGGLIRRTHFDDDIQQEKVVRI